MKKEKILEIINKNEGIERINIGEDLLEKYLAKNPNDIDAWLRLAVLENSPPMCDFPKAIDCLLKVLEIDPNNFEAAMLLAYTFHYHFPDTEFGQEVLELLSRLKTDDQEKQSMIEYAKAMIYELSDEKYIIEYEQALLKSISLHQNHVANYRALSRFYRLKGKKLKAIEFADKAIKNVQKIYSEDDDSDWTSYNEDLNEFIKGTYLTSATFDFLKENFEECKDPNKIPKSMVDGFFVFYSRKGMTFCNRVPISSADKS